VFKLIAIWCVRCRHGSVEALIQHASASASAPALHSSVYNKVLALDCAYHFPRRSEWWNTAFQLLQSSASASASASHSSNSNPKSGSGSSCMLALTDLVLHDSCQRLSRPPLATLCTAPKRWLAYAHSQLLHLLILPTFARLCSIPPHNLLTSRSQYTSALQRCGFDAVHCTPIDAHVMLPFAEFVAAHHHSLHPLFGAANSNSKLWMKFKVTALLMRWAVRYRWLHYVLVTAVKP
jgi:hypothetical protein